MIYRNILLPGVYFYNRTDGSVDSGMQGVPIFCSFDTISLIQIGCNDIDEKVLVLPGFKVDLWTGAITSTPSLTVDNTNGTTYLYKAGTPRAATFCKVYYNNVLIENCMSTTGT